MGDIGGVYKVTSFLIGRSAYTHELASYGNQASEALRAAHPDLPTSEMLGEVTAENYKEVLSIWIDKLGDEIELSDALKDCLADDKNCIETLQEMKPDVSIIPINNKLT